MNRQKIIYLQGGLGNVLFQIVAYLSLLEKGYDIKIVTVLTNKNLYTNILGWKIHDLSYQKIVDALNIEELKVTNIQLTKHLILGKLSKMFKKKILGVLFFDDQTENFVLSDINFGYFQNKSFLIQNYTQIKQVSNILNIAYSSRIKLSTRIVVHIRLGDSNWAKTNSDYYFKVINVLKEKREPFTVVTDSIVSAKIIFKDFENVFYQSNTPIDDFGLILKSKILFIAPSTFSYWAGISIEKPLEIYMPKFIYNKYGNPLKKKVFVL